MNTVEVLKTSRENPMIYFSGFLYTQHRITEKKSIFRCEDRDCITTAGLPTNDALLQIIRRERPAMQLDHQGRLPLI
ncbi:unnamed protein product [Rotaria sp. Silwood2]|nr:unnamed protein product [Rotaria sp. Silwood2]